VESLRAFVRDGVRNAAVLKDLKAYFRLTDAQMEAYFGNVQ
jgi:hypothetical protein